MPFSLDIFWDVNPATLDLEAHKNKLMEVPISPEDKQRVKTAAEAIRRITEENIFPAAAKAKKRCVECTYRNICVK